MKYYYLLIIIPFVLSCGKSNHRTLNDYPNANLLISTLELESRLSESGLLIIDVRPAAADSNFIPGAIHFPAVARLTDQDNPIPNYLVSAEKFEELMREIGLNNNHKVVIYDAGNALMAARLFYALDYFGFSNARILNGGLAAWAEEKLPVVHQSAKLSEGNFTVSVQEAKFCDLNYIVAASTDPNKIIFDARSADEYTGDDARGINAGHVPGAINLEWSKVIEDEGIPFFKPASAIQAMYDSLGLTRDKEVIPHCHTNVRGSHAYFTLRLMGFDSVRAYEGSWSEYGQVEGVPVTR